MEETHSIGGISRTVFHNGNRMDIGGHRFFTKDKDVNKAWEALMPTQGQPAYDDKHLGRNVSMQPDGPDPEKEDRVMLRRNRVSRIYYNRKFFDYPIKMNLNTIKNMGLWTTIKAGVSYIAAAIRKIPETSLEAFYVNRFGRKLYEMFFEGYTEKLWGRHPKEISADWGAQRVKGLSILAIIKDGLTKTFCKKENRKSVETSLIEEFSYPKYGPGQLWETMANAIESMGGTIRTGCRVVSLLKDGEKVNGITYEAGDGIHEEQADYVISSMPLHDLIGGMAWAPQPIKDIAEGLPYRDFVTVGLLLKKLALKNETEFKTLSNIVPDCWIYVQDTGVKLGRIQIFNNWSPYMVADPERTVWIGLEYFCKEGDFYWNMPEKDWVEMGMEELRKMGVISANEEALDYHMEKVKKAYPAYFDTYADIDTLIEWLNGHENLFCIGRNGQHRYNNMDHSMATAFEAVKDIETGEKDKANVWSVNTEKEYHEDAANENKGKSAMDVGQMLRYVVCGGTAFIVDYLILRLLYNAVGLYAATALAFVAGFITNQYIAIHYVFRTKRNNAGKSLPDNLIVLAISIIGLILTELGMHVGTKYLTLNYKFAKVIVAGIVMVWNYAARVLTVYRPRKEAKTNGQTASHQ